MNIKRNLSLPEELWIEIIVRLPVKSLLCLKCVSKFWYDLIQSPNFVSYHYHNPFNLPKLLVCHSVPSQNDYETMNLGFSLFPGEIRVAEFENKHSFSVVGPVQGLFMFHKCDTNDVGVWNPATSEFKQLPKPNLSIRFEDDEHYYRWNVFGFGINPLTNEYKVVCTPSEDYRRRETKTSAPSIKHHCSLWPRKGAAVCTFGGDGDCSWRDINGPELGERWWIVGGIDFKSDATYLNGCYYWLSKYLCRKGGIFGKYYYKLVVFDMRTDKFTEMATPSYLNHNNDHCSESNGYSSGVTNIINLALHGDGNIALLVKQKKYQRVNELWKFEHTISFSVIIMKNKVNPAEENWIKVYSHKLAPNVCKKFRLPLGIWKNNGVFFLNNRRQLLLYSNASQEIVDLGVNTDNYSCHFNVTAYNYKESLVSFGGQKKQPVFQDYFA